MIYRVRLSMAFIDQDPAIDILEEIRRRFPDAITINPDTSYVERSFYIYEKCRHDEHPSLPCEIIEQQWTD